MAQPGGDKSRRHAVGHRLEVTDRIAANQHQAGGRGLQAGLDNASPVALLVFRFLIALVALAPLAILRRRWLPPARRCPVPSG
jgi:hypothetical protein